MQPESSYDNCDPSLVMQDRSWNDTLPLSLLRKEACPPGGVSLEGDGHVVSVPSLDGEVYLDSMAELDSGDGDFPELSAFLSQDEINLSLDLAREAMSDAGDSNDLDEPPVTTEHLSLYSETKDHALQDSASQSADTTSGKVTSNQSMPLSRPNQPCTAPESPEKFICQKSITPVYKQDRPRLVHRGLELNERAASATEFCSRAATFIEELSSIFKGSTRVDQQGDEDSSSPDSGYLSPRSHRLAMQQAQPPSSSSSSSEPQQEGSQQDRADVGSDEHQGRGVSLDGPMAPPHFTQKLKSQEVAEGSPIRLECRVTGNPLPLVRCGEARRLVNIGFGTELEEPQVCHCATLNKHADFALALTDLPKLDANMLKDTLVIVKWGAVPCQPEHVPTHEFTPVSVDAPARESVPEVTKEVGTEPLLHPGTVVKHEHSIGQINKHREGTVELYVCFSHSSTHYERVVETGWSWRTLETMEHSHTDEEHTGRSGVTGDRWFCEGRELHHCPDIQICRDGDLHTLVITEAFEDDTGRYTCVASNALGADNTSAEVYIEGASSSDSEGEGSVSKSRSGAMPQYVQSPVSSLYASDAHVKAAPSFTKMLQDAQASEGQVVVLECRVKGSLPLQVQWFREGQEIQDSPDFRILQKKPRSAAEPEEICTLVIAEAFPEDGGLFCCTATNQYGSVNSTAKLTVTPVAEEFPSNGVSGDESVFEDNQSFPPPPPPPPPTEISLLEVPPKTPPSAEAFQINELDIWPSITALPVQVSTDKEPHESLPNRPLQNGQTLNKPPDESLPSPSSVKETAAPPPSPSAVKAPPLPTKPKPKL
ncbi:Palladin [Anabarilius grahami]|uniref:Palladin n=1 Tax=Anabarilius grahami TaxID=495550 RepID=A0A3N0YXG7_ANAGA|nr:Palladin [Anabarilius grahami]